MACQCEINGGNGGENVWRCRNGNENNIGEMKYINGGVIKLA
jgi:hypothetical protein